MIAIYRVILNTGRREPLTPAPGDEMPITELGRLITPGKHTWQWPERWRIEAEITEMNAWFMIFPGFTARVPATLAGVAWTNEGAEELWPQLERSYLSYAEQLLERGTGFPDELLAAPERPEIPWLAVSMMPGIARLDESELDALSQLERALAFALVRWGEDQ